MSLETFVSFLEKYLNEDISIYKFNELVSGKGIMLEVQSSEDTIAGVDEFVIIINTKDRHPSKAEALASSIIKKLDKVNNKIIEDYQLILIVANYSQPTFLGTTEANEYVFCCEFKVLLNKL